MAASIQNSERTGTPQNGIFSYVKGVVSTVGKIGKLARIIISLGVVFQILTMGASQVEASQSKVLEICDCPNLPGALFASVRSGGSRTFHIKRPLTIRQCFGSNTPEFTGNYCTYLSETDIEKLFDDHDQVRNEL